ncbi:hypothetical protein ASD8599_03477 [Ascidiaceihabitans donghaensis]|uniref:DUF4864 domain-containing protein n=1 Tax=Ascidiaceihabitans donghaensis TaxID=1510460 RepID=A0A2R8BI78_9RHOB|nr:DUF4864 domain-containing protein [Ascidiaceihabitans donghaensis]SPH22731.1 hypothetical protein ASD8599_03477 [Ascidiaceihabitans donghaensis]
MLKTLKMTVIAAVMAGGAWAQDLGIQNTIRGQIEAFKVDDFDAAFAFASPNIQRIFGSVARFQKMVTTGYPMVWRPSDVRYLEQEEIAGDIWQKVLIKDQDGVTHVLGYRMLETEDGWKINGVQLLPQPDVNA